MQQANLKKLDIDIRLNRIYLNCELRRPVIYYSHYKKQDIMCRMQIGVSWRQKQYPK